MDVDFYAFSKAVNETNKTREEALKCSIYVLNRALRLSPEMRSSMIEHLIRLLEDKNITQ